jgi:chemotaxis protein MotB
MPEKKKNRDAADSTGSWMTTFTNLVILLLAFFVVLVVMSEPTEEKVMAGMSSLFGAFGISPEGLSPTSSTLARDITTDEPPIARTRIVQARLQEALAANGLLSGVEIRREGERVIVSLGERVLFEFGSSRLKDGGVPFLRDLGELIDSEEGQVEMRGYADPSETVFSEDPLMEAYDLSIRRVLLVRRLLEKDGGVEEGRLTAHGFGTRPGPRKASEPEAWRGSQVEIILDYSTPLPYRIRSAKNRPPFLEYKGFLFRRMGD